jgi:hypothetical protein
LCELCQLLEASWWLSEVGCVYFVNLLRQGVRTPSINYGALAGVNRGGGNFSVTYAYNLTNLSVSLSLFVSRSSSQAVFVLESSPCCSSTHCLYLRLPILASYFPPSSGFFYHNHSHFAPSNLCSCQNHHLLVLVFCVVTGASSLLYLQEGV